MSLNLAEYVVQWLLLCTDIFFVHVQWVFLYLIFFIGMVGCHGNL